MADLFDMKVGGLGFHITSHIIAIAALFVACFAITGYITFRDESIPDSALADDADDTDILSQSVSIPVSAAGVFSNKFTFTQPANSYISDIDVLCTDGYTDGVVAVQYSVGTTLDGVDILALQDFGAVGAHTAGELEENAALAAQRYSSVSRTIHVTVKSPATGTVTAAGALDVIVRMVKL